MDRASGTGALSGHGLDRGRRWTALTTLLAGGLLLAPAAAWALPARAPLAQDVATDAQRPASSQVIAQGISRLPKGELAWTMRRLDVPGEKGTAVGTFPLGFALADGAAVALLDDAGEVLGILDDGEAIFLPNGKGGALASWRAETAGVFEVGLVSAEDAANGETAGSVVGTPFTAPDGRSFEIELARETLAGDEAVTVPVARSGAPILFLVTSGTVQLTPPGGEPVELAAGQHALLLGEVIAQRAGDTPAAFVVGAIGDAVASQGASADGTPEARAGRGDRQRARDGGAEGGEKAAKVKKAKQPKVKGTGGGRGQGGGGRGGGQGGQGGGQGGQGGQTQQPQAPGDTGQPPATGAGAPTASTPTPETLPQDPVPASPTVPDDGVPAPDATPPGEEAAPDGEDTVVQNTTDVVDDDEVVQQETDPAGDETAPVDEDVIDESAAQTTPKETLPIEEAPAADAAVEDQVGVEHETAAENTPPEPEQVLPVEEAPAAPVEGEQPVDPVP